MAGHSKWSNIQHRKGAKDAKRGQVFTRLIREVTLAARHGPDPSQNSRLRAAVDKALSQNMSKDTIQKAINKGAGLDGSSELVEVLYEGYGPGGVAFLVFCATDNTNRSVSEIRHIFSKCGGAMGTPGSVSYLFEEQGLIELSEPQERHEAITELLLEHDGVRDIEESAESLLVICDPEALSSLVTTLKEAGFQVSEQEKQQCAQTQIPYSTELAESVQKLYDKLDNHDDVQQLACNFSWSEGSSP